MVFQSYDRLAPRQGGERCAYRGDSFNQAGMNATVDDSIRLAMLLANFQVRHNFIGCGKGEVNAHGLVPASTNGVERGGKVTIRRSGEAGTSGHSGQF